MSDVGTRAVIDRAKLPHHVAIIMDGNGRWARRRALPRQAGHSAGVKAARRVVEACAQKGIGMLTLFAFSSENWSRPPQEVSSLMSLFVEVLQREVDNLCRNNVRLQFVGQREALPKKLQRHMQAAETLTIDNDGLRLVVAMAYGGRWDILQATRALAREVREGRIGPDQITVDDIACRLALGGLPDPDLFIRTGGEHRISNFLLWNLAYSEMYFSEALWPAFDVAELDAALDFFAHRQRRFGRIAEQLEAAR